MTLHPCFQLALRAGLEVEESWPTRRQCSGAVWRHRQTVERSCPALRQFEGTWPPSFTYTDGCFTTTATGSGACSLDSQPSNMKECSMRALVQQYPRRFLKMGSSVVGRLTNVALPVNSWFGPAHFGLMSQERSGATSASTRGALWCHALGKRKGIWCLVWSFGNALCLYANGLP